ncbi:MAG: DUF4091 domain-containing protein [Tannerellaceae bacterium]|nr:DUF4091 domain-containing protein [Tannerellaceae bacterium]MCD8265059.1 DUF4091 domain-containing protein [Tannerellaceae bacterium]
MKKTLYLLLVCTIGVSAYGQISTNHLSPPSDYEELTDSKLYESREVWDKQVKTPQFSWASTDVRYPKRSIPQVRKSTKLKVKAWKGEQVNAQAVLWTSKPLEKATIQVSDLRNGSSVIPATAANASFVRYIMTDELNKDGKGGCGHRPNKADWDSSMVADVLDVIKIRDISEYTTQPVWLNVWIPQHTPKGIYKGILTVAGENFSRQQISLEIEVLEHTLPRPQDWNFHLDLWQNPYAVARYYEVPLWSEAHFDAMRPIFKLLADAGQKAITTTIMHKPWNGQTQDHFESMVLKIKKLDGSWAYDYTVFDKWVEFMMNEIGITKQINCFTMIPWALHFDYLDQASNTIKFMEAKPGDTAYEAYWTLFLKDFSQHLHRKGWFNITIISMDEREMEQMIETVKLIRQVDPEFKISFQGHYHAEHNLTCMICACHTGIISGGCKRGTPKDRQKSTVYTCCSEAFPNVFTFSSPAEATWLGWHTAAGNYDGYLRWAYNSWTLDPLRDSRFRTWAAGDCYLVYPDGRSSIRLERLIEGVQDFEKITILRKEFTEKGELRKLEKLNNLISTFEIDGLSPLSTEEQVQEAKKLLNSL